MSSDWEARLLVPPGYLARVTPDDVLAVVGPYGFGAPKTWDGTTGFHGITEDGAGDLVFPAFGAGWTHVRSHGGLVTLFAHDGSDLALAVGRVAGLLPRELVVAGDTAVYDEVRVSLSGPNVRERGRAWAFVDAGLPALAAAVGARFGFGLWDEGFELLVPLRVHASIAVDAHPPAAFDWSLAPADSAAGHVLAALADAGTGSCRHIGGMVEHRLAPDVTAVPVDELLRARAAVVRLRGHLDRVSPDRQRRS